MGPTWVLSVPDGPHDSPMNLAIRAVLRLLTYWHRLEQARASAAVVLKTFRRDISILATKASDNFTRAELSPRKFRQNMDQSYFSSIFPPVQSAKFIWIHQPILHIDIIHMHYVCDIGEQAAMSGSQLIWKDITQFRIQSLSFHPIKPRHNCQLERA